MTEEEMFEQLNSLIIDRKSFITDDKESNEVFEKDIKALETIIKGYKEFEIELSGYRASLLKSVDNNSFVLQQRIDKAINYIENNSKSAKDDRYYIDSSDLLSILQDKEAHND